VHDQSQNSQHGLVQFTCGIALAVIFCWILVIGQSLIVPILLGVIGVYLFVSAADGLAKFGPFKGLRRLWRRLIVVLLALLLIAVLADFLVRNSFNIASALPVYGSNLSQMLSPYALIYGLFLGFELDDLPVKTKKALNGVGNAGNAIKMIQKINQRIAGYLSAKTAINVILGALSLVVFFLIHLHLAKAIGMTFMSQNVFGLFLVNCSIIGGATIAYSLAEGWSLLDSSNSSAGLGCLSD